MYWWNMQSIDYVIAFPKSPIKVDIYMIPPKVPRLFKITYLKHPSDVFTTLYMVLENLFGLQDSESTCFDFLKDGPINRGWEQ